MQALIDKLATSWQLETCPMAWWESVSLCRAGQREAVGCQSDDKSASIWNMITQLHAHPKVDGSLTEWKGISLAFWQRSPSSFNRYRKLYILQQWGNTNKPHNLPRFNSCYRVAATDFVGSFRCLSIKWALASNCGVEVQMSHIVPFWR